MVSKRLLQQLFANFPFLLCHQTLPGQAKRHLLPIPFCSCLMYLGDNNCALRIWAWHRTAQEGDLASSQPAELSGEILRVSWECFWHQDASMAGVLPCPGGTQPLSMSYFHVHALKLALMVLQHRSRAWLVNEEVVVVSRGLLVLLPITDTPSQS